MSKPKYVYLGREKITQRQLIVTFLSKEEFSNIDKIYKDFKNWCALQMTIKYEELPKSAYYRSIKAEVRYYMQNGLETINGRVTKGLSSVQGRPKKIEGVTV